MTFNSKHILVPTDFSEYSKKSFTQALLIASKTDAKVTLLHCIEPPYDFASTVESTLEQIKRGSKRRLDEMYKQAMKDERFSSVQIDTVLITGMAKASIMEIVQTRHVDLIVMGSMGVSGLRKKLFGSTSTDVALRSEVPVLIVPETQTDKGFDQILFATDYRENDLESLGFVSGLAGLFDSTIHVVHIADDDNFQTDLSFRGFRDLVKEQIQYDPLNFDQYYEKSPFRGLSRYIENNKIEMLVITKYKKTVLKSLFDKNHTKEMSQYSALPVFVIPG